MNFTSYYIKSEYKGKAIKIEFTGSELFATCFKCGSELQLDEELIQMIIEEGDFMSTRISCGCTDEPSKPKLTRIK